MQTVTVYVVCVVTFIVHTSYFLFSFLLLERGICGIPSTSLCSLAILLIFSFNIIFSGFFRCLICWFCWSNPFTVTIIWKDTGILEEIIYFNLLFLLVGFFRRWWYIPFVFRRTSFLLKTIFSLVICDFYTSFCLLFDWISVAFLWISCNRLNWIKWSFSLLRLYLLFSMVLVSCVQCFFRLCQMFHSPCSFWKSGRTVLIAGCEKYHFSSLYSSWLCRFFSIDNWRRLMLLTKHVIRLNHYHCRNSPVYGNIV